MLMWISIDDSSDFPLQNIPFGVFSPNVESSPRCGTAIGSYAVDLSVLQEHGLLLAGSHCFSRDSLNEFMTMGRSAWKEARSTLQALFSGENPALKDNKELQTKCMFAIDSVKMHLPAHIGDYTDFYASKEHASNLGKMLRPGMEPLLPNWVHLPVGYHGRSSSIVPSGTPVRRPRGQTKADDAPAPSFTPCRLLDFELEMGFFVGGAGNALGEPIKINEARDHIFGLVMLNDWSARDVQKWEYVPLGPFGAKNFATTISPWIVTLEALEPFIVDAPAQDPSPLPYLLCKDGNRTFDIELEVSIQPKDAAAAHTVTHSNLKYMYWTLEQMLTHHTITGCNMRPGDLLGTGTISSPDDSGRGSLIEITWRGANPITFPDGTQRKFLEDGDVVNLRGYCQGQGYRIGFGSCAGQIVPALPSDHI